MLVVVDSTHFSDGLSLSGTDGVVCAVQGGGKSVVTIRLLFCGTGGTQGNLEKMPLETKTFNEETFQITGFHSPDRKARIKPSTKPVQTKLFGIFLSRTKMSNFQVIWIFLSRTKTSQHSGITIQLVFTLMLFTHV